MTVPSPELLTYEGLAKDRARLIRELATLRSEFEFEFVLARVEAEGNRVYPRCWGISSNALAVYALGRGRRPERVRDFPWDEDDLSACERTYAMAPEHLRERMLPVLEEYRSAVRDRSETHR